MKDGPRQWTHIGRTINRKARIGRSGRLMVAKKGRCDERESHPNGGASSK